METEATRELIEQYYSALTKGDEAGVTALLAGDCRWTPPATAPFDPVEGGAAIASLLCGDVVKTTFDLSQPFKLEVRSTTVEGDRAVVQQRIQATAKNGNPYDNEYVWVYTCADGRIALIEEYADTLLASTVMGWD